MLRKVAVLGLLAIAVACLPARAVAAEEPATGKTLKFAFDDKESLARWTITGDVSIDTTKGREGGGGALKIAPGGKAVLKLRDEDASGRFELWVYDDTSTPEKIKVARVGPHWGIVGTDGRVLAPGILYATYLGGNEGYTSTACDGKRWFDELCWLGVRRAPAAWHKWTIEFDPSKGALLLHNDKDINTGPRPRFDNTKVGMKGFNAVAIWGDVDNGKSQTIWVDDVTVTLGGPVKSVPQPKPVAPTRNGPNPWVPSGQKVTMYTKDNAPATPKLEDLELKQSVSQYGITWTFDKPARVGRFVNGDIYVVGPVTITALDPKPLYGADIPEIELDHMDLERPVAQRVRNGFMLNPPARPDVAYDSGIRVYWRPNLIQRLPVAMKAGDSLVSTISMPKGLVLQAQLRNKIERGKGDSSPIRTAAVLTCVAAPQPPDAFRPAFCDREQKIYFSRDLKRAALPTAAATPSIPKVELYARFTQRPWVGTCFFGFEEPVENMPQYGLEYGRVAGISALLLCTDLKPEQKEVLLVNYVQIGIDLGGMVRAGHPGWTGWGGHGSGRKLPIVVAGLLLGDDQLANINAAFPKASFGEDEQTAYGDCWTGAKVVFAGHSGIDAATGTGRSRNSGWGPYEHMQPSTWKGGQITSENYRRCCTSVGWPAQALTIRLMKTEKQWNHGAFLDYCDRWMFENDAEFIKIVKKDTGRDYSADWARQEQTWDEFVNEMWAKYRAGCAAPVDGWKKQHDDTRYRKAIETMK